MQLEFKPNLDQTLETWKGFWKGTNQRPMILATLPRPGCKPVEAPPYLTAFDCDFHDLAHRLLAWAETHEFLGDTIPNYYLEFGPETFATYLGCDLQLAEDRSTSWSIPFVEDWDKVEVRFHPESYWWQRTVEAVDILRSHLDGKMMVAAPALLGNLDALSSLRGPQNLLIDLVDRPQQIQRALAQVRLAHTEILGELARLLDMDRDGSMNVEGLYYPGRHSRPQCDFSAMISPAMFREFVIPCLESEAQDTGTITYHLDGPRAVCHVPALCAIEKLDIIIFAIGAGTEDWDWTFLYDQIDRLGKGQILYQNMTPANIKAAWQKYQSRKLAFPAVVTTRGEVEDVVGELATLKKMMPS
jgi:hypothetical protein